MKTTLSILAALTLLFFIVLGTMSASAQAGVSTTSDKPTMVIKSKDGSIPLSSTVGLSVSQYVFNLIKQKTEPVTAPSPESLPDVQPVYTPPPAPVQTASAPIQSDDYYINWIINVESNDNPYAVNPVSGACGLFQRLPCDVPLGDVAAQMADGIAYIANTYGSAYNAYLFHIANGWY